MHHGEVVFYHGDGWADVGKQIVPTEDTVFPVASCSKAFTTASCGLLVADGKLSWAEPIQTYVPQFETKHDPEVGKRATLVDLCSHGTGLAPVDHSVCGFYDEFFNDVQDEVYIASKLPKAYDFRSRFLYNNTILGVVGDIIAKVSGKTSGAFLHERILKPLGMTRTCTKNDELPDDGNIAVGYSVLDDGSLSEWKLPVLEDGSLQAGAGYVRSTARDMMIWAKAVMEAEGSQTFGLSHAETKQDTAYAESPLQQMPFIRTAHRPMIEEKSPFENSYALGWFRHMLPSSWLGSIGPNFGLFADPPVINARGPPRLAIAHWGEFNGFLTSFYTFPETQSAVIVMANCSPGRGDPTDLIAQELIQNLFQMQPPVDFEYYASLAAETSRLHWPALVQEWVTKRTQNTKHRPLEEYIGIYNSSDFKLTLNVYELDQDKAGSGPSPELLGFNVNSLSKQSAKLRHYHHDTWTFIPDSRDDAVKKGMEGFMQLSLLLLAFVANDNDEIHGLEWDLQGGKCEGPAPGLGAAVAPIFFERM